MPQKSQPDSPQRKLAAIMFTDIEGYTAIMQEDEKKAINFRDQHRKIFKTINKKYQGQILQYYGDGTLSVFDSVISAVNCAIEMQRAFLNGDNSIVSDTEIPVRIGIHLGDIIFTEEDIIGDSVNIASRIESLATVGSVLVSDKVFDEISNQSSIETKSMGWFELKNVEKPIQIFAISNKGLKIPNPRTIQGKAKKIKFKETLIKDLWDSGQIQVVIGYFAGVWGLIEVIDWMLIRYQISPYWTDITLVFFLSLIPSLLLYVWSKNRILNGKLNLFEKLFLPGNLIFSVFLLFMLFKGTDLGATTKVITYNNENGVEQYKTIIKSGFRKKLAIHNFLPENEDSLNQWMGWGVHAAIAEDITQNQYLTIGFWNKTQSLQEIIELSKEDFYSHCLTGSYSVEGNVYTITSKLYRTQNGRLQKSHTFSGRDFFAIIDSISAATKKDLGFNQKQIDQFVDLPFVEAYTSNIEAYKNYSLFFGAYSLRYLEKAVALDSTFALANYNLAQFLFSSSYSYLGAKEAINQAMRFRKRLPEAWKSNVKLLYFQINNQPEKAIALLKMQLEMNPDDQNIMQRLSHYLHLTENYEELLTWKKKLAIVDPNPDTKIDVAEAFLLNGMLDKAGQNIKEILDQYPNYPDALGALTSYYALNSQFDKAESLLQKLVIQDPELEPLANEYIKSFHYANEHHQSAINLEKYLGHYRLQNLPAEFDIKIINNHLFGKRANYMDGFFFIPSGPEEFLFGGENYYEKWEFISDTIGRVYKIEAYREERGNKSFNNILWRQDSLIQKAMGLFFIGKKHASLIAFKEAYLQNPQHFYLNQYIKHLEFILNPVNRAAIENLKKCVGRYGPRHIWIDDQKFYYRRDGMVSKQHLLPVSPNLFYFGGGFQFQMQVVVENDEIKGTVSWEYNNETGEFVRDDKDFIPFDKLKE